jgi:ACS family glucarate transporter-like MFS transporter
MTANSATDAPLSSTGKRLLVLLAAAASAGYVCRVAITVVAPGIMHDFRLTQAEMGTVFSAFLVGYTLFQVPSGWLADRVSPRRIFLVLCGGFTLLTLFTALVGWPRLAPIMVIPELWLVRGLFGVIAAPTYPTSARTIAVTIPSRLQARANSVVLASVGIGSAVTPLLLTPVSTHYGWRAALLVAASLGVFAGMLWWFFAPKEHHVGQSDSNRAADDIADNHPDHSSRPLRSRSFWFLFASYLLQGYLGYIFIFWFYLYLVQVRHLEVLKAASFSAFLGSRRSSRSRWEESSRIWLWPAGEPHGDAAVCRSLHCVYLRSFL